jgi:hypothetical protein
VHKSQYLFNISAGNQVLSFPVIFEGEWSAEMNDPSSALYKRRAAKFKNEVRKYLLIMYSPDLQHYYYYYHISIRIV